MRVADLDRVLGFVAPRHGECHPLSGHVDDWFHGALVNPSFFKDGNTVGAVTWFQKSTAGEMIDRLAPLQGIWSKHRVSHIVVESLDPGRLIYEDQFQIGVVPYRRRPPTPMPDGLVLGPTTAGSKRHLGKKARGVHP